MICCGTGVSFPRRIPARLRGRLQRDVRGPPRMHRRRGIRAGGMALPERGRAGRDGRGGLVPALRTVRTAHVQRRLFRNVRRDLRALLVRRRHVGGRVRGKLPGRLHAVRRMRKWAVSHGVFGAWHRRRGVRFVRARSDRQVRNERVHVLVRRRSGAGVFEMLRLACSRRARVRWRVVVINAHETRRSADRF
jgi:hypothetical protein